MTLTDLRNVRFRAELHRGCGGEIPLAELIVALKATADQATIVTRGSIDHRETCDVTCNILEGSREAFERRAAVYGVAGG